MQCSRRILDAMGSVAVDVLDLLDCHKEGKSSYFKEIQVGEFL